MLRFVLATHFSDECFYYQHVIFFHILPLISKTIITGKKVKGQKRATKMASCCSIVFVFFAGISLIVGVVSLFVPLFAITATTRLSYSSDVHATTETQVPSGHPAHKFLQELGASSGSGSLSGNCPFFNGKCSGMFEDTETDAFLTLFGCSGLLGTSRAFGVIGAILAAKAVLIGLFAACTTSPAIRTRRVGLFKFGCSGAAFANCVSAVINAHGQMNVRNCLMDSTTFGIVFNGLYLTMVSMIVVLVAGGIMGWCFIGMLCSWWCACCGEQPGRVVYIAQPVQYVAVQGQQTGVYAQPLVQSPVGCQQPQQPVYAAQPAPYGQAAYAQPPPYGQPSPYPAPYVQPQQSYAGGYPAQQAQIQ